MAEVPLEILDVCRSYAALWRATLLATGVTALSTWAIASSLLTSPRFARGVLWGAGIELGIYSGVVLFFSQAFWLALAVMLPAFFFLVVVLGLAFRRERQKNLLLMGAGPALTLLAGLLQQLGVGIHPVYFNHNAVYHILDLIALGLFFQGGRW